MICPKCGRSFKRLLALSRIDNETNICDECGTMEALGDLPPGAITAADQQEILEAVREANRRVNKNEYRGKRHPN